MRPFGCESDRAAGCRIPSSTRLVSASRPQRWPACRLICTQSSSARTSSGRSSEPSGRMSHSLPRRIRNGASRSFAAAISSPCRRMSSPSSPGTARTAARVVADRDVLVAHLLRRQTHLVHARLTVRRSRVQVQVAANVLDLNEVRRRVGRVDLAQLRRPLCQTDVGVHLRLCASFGQRLEGRDVVGRPGRPHERRPEPLDRGERDLDGVALAGHAHAPLRRPLEHGDDLGQPLELVERPGLADDDGEARRELAAATRIARGLAAEGRRDLADELTGTVEQHPAPRPCRSRLRQAGADPLGRLRPDARHLRQPAVSRRLAQACDRANVERRAELPHPLRREPEQPADADELGHGLVLELAELGELAGRDELAQAGLDPRPDARELANAAGTHELGDIDRRRPDQLGGAPVGANGVVAGSGEIEQRGERLEPFRQKCVVHAGIVSPERWSQSSSPSAASAASGASRRRRSCARSSPWRCSGTS